MTKTIIKEVIITLLLCLAILLVLSIIFYDYNPINKVVPSKIAYTTPENVKNELEENIQNSFELQSKVYTVEGSDLNIYKKSNTYNQGKANPFATSAVVDNSTSNVTGNSVTNNNNGNTTNNNTTNTNNTNKQNTILNQAGK